MISAVNNLMSKVSKDVIMELPKKATKLQDTLPGQLSKVTDKIPSPETIKSRICGTNDMNTAKKMYNQMGDTMDKAQKIIDKIKGLIEKLNNLIGKVKSILEGILSIADTINTIIKTLKATIIGLKAGVTGVAFIPSTVATPIPVGPVLLLKDGIKKADDTVKLFSNVIKGITGKVEYIIPKLNKIEGIAATLNSLPNLPQNKLDMSKDTMDQCMKDKLIAASPPADSLEDGAEGGVDAQNQTLDSLIDKENRNQENTTKIEEFGYGGFPKTEEYTVKTIPSENLEN
jgi:uncharacterized protein YoxC